MQRAIQAAQVLPEDIRRAVCALPPHQLERLEEVHLRAGRAPAIVLPEGGQRLPLPSVTPEVLQDIVDAASRWSLHAVLPQVRCGYLTLEGGHRLGLCGRAVMEGEHVHTLGEFSSLNLRVARQVRGAADAVVPRLWEGEGLQSTLILAPPGTGKTTLLRDLIRCLSDGEGCRPLRVGVADERGELCACRRGLPQLELGERTDVVEGCPKAQGLLLLLRGMNPQVLAADEITAPEDLAAVQQAAGCGVALLATAHAHSPEDLRRRTLYRELMEQKIFRRLVTIRREGGRRVYEVEAV